ncbi:Transcriptional regulatory protein NatR [Emticicia aquatica]|jgi:DNA-binding LytR/AlgR family response regulator|uniref:Transcriptional regulatory protein NatR n=1 Tax=Emticicia aquatica TaxID=1681835 RepID=A0ABN8EX59_9BACT|nr:LytTR family DNA-binding domain-containing protein [Emticicia aquatica]CAH0996363.1 Transcriptional regulatory protein NatR [Emticicia aquatica]
MKILLIEDEALVAKNLENLVKQLEPTAILVATIGSVKEAFEWFKENAEPDLILSDIQLSDGVSFDIFQQIQPKCPIIFTTAYDEYAIRAFKLNSIDYLLKPIDKDELRNAFEKFNKLTNTESNGFKEQLNHLLYDLENRATLPKFKTRFTAHHQRNIVAVTAERIACFYRDEVIWIQTTDNQRLITDYNSLDEIEELLNPEVFFRANRQFITNKQAIESYRTHFTGKIELKLVISTKEEIVVSKEKAHQFRGWFEL